MSETNYDSVDFGFQIHELVLTPLVEMWRPGDVS